MDKGRKLLETLCNLEIPADIHISPWGQYVLYSTDLTWGHTKDKFSTTKLWLATFGEEGSSKQITDGTHKDHLLTWHPSKDEFAFVSDRAGHGVKSAIYTVSLDQLTDVKPLTPVENEQAIEKFQFSPDGKLIAFISKDEKTAEEKRREEEREDVQVWGQGYRYSRLRVLNLETGETKTLSLERHVLDFCWISHTTGEAGELPEIGFVNCENTLIEYPYRHGTQINIASINLTEARTICSLPGRANDLSWGSTNLGEKKALYFTSGTELNKNFSGFTLYKIDPNDNPCKPKQAMSSVALDVSSIRSTDGRMVVKVQHRLEDCLIQPPAVKLVSCQQEIEAYAARFIGEGRPRLAVATSDVNHPVEVYSIDEQSKKVQLSQHGASLQGYKFGTFCSLSCPTTDQYRVEIDAIYLSPAFQRDGTQDIPSKPYPTVVLIHGGPSTRITNAFNMYYYMLTPYLLSLGYGILLPNYRGGSGRGTRFSSFAYSSAGTYAYEDVITLTQHATQQGYADPARLVVGGYSHGGLLSNTCSLRNGLHGHGWTFKAAISGSSISDIDSMALTSDMGLTFQAELHSGSTPWTMASDDITTRSNSVLWSFRDAVERTLKGKPTIPPILILHGASDERCPISQAYGLQRALEYYSQPFEMAIYPRQGHIFHEQFFWIDMGLRIGRWVERYIGATL